jgi:DNA-binding transcriptional regulator YdaS (Cro superfamily)
MDKLRQFFDESRGRRSALAEALGISPSAISMWTAVPAERVLEIERLTGVSRHELRPDVFGPAPQEAAE